MKIRHLILIIVIISGIFYYYKNYIVQEEKEKKIILPFELLFEEEEKAKLQNKINELRQKQTVLIDKEKKAIEERAPNFFQLIEKQDSISIELSAHRKKLRDFGKDQRNLIPKFSRLDDSSVEYFRQFPDFREKWKDKFLFLDEAIKVITYYSFDTSPETIRALPEIKGFIEDSMEKFKLAAAYIEQNEILSDTDKVRLSYIYYNLGLYIDEYSSFFDRINNSYEGHELQPEFQELFKRKSLQEKIKLEPELREIIDSLRPEKGYHETIKELEELISKYFEKAYYYAPESRWGERAGGRLQRRLRSEKRSENQKIFRNTRSEYIRARTQIYRAFENIESGLWRSEWSIRRQRVSREVYDRERERNKKFRNARWKIRLEEGRHYSQLSRSENKRYRKERKEIRFEEVYMDDIKKLAEIAVRYSEQAQALYNEYQEKREENRGKKLSPHQHLAFHKQYFNQINSLVRDYISEINEPYMRIHQKDFNNRLFEIYR
jgi:hypothetical protein